MSKKEENTKKEEKAFDVDDFYRKLGIWLLVLLLVMLTTIGIAMLITQKAILKSMEPNYIHKSETQYIDSEYLKDVMKSE